MLCGYCSVTTTTNAGLNIEKVKAAIAQDLKPVSSYKVYSKIQGTVIVDGVTITYGGTKLPNGKINIGKIKPPRQ